jgi:tRNA modification GTPase
MESIFRDSIVALSSGRLPSGVAVVRMSGAHVRFALETIAGLVPPPRRATLCTFCEAGRPIDSGLALFFPGPASFTGEDVAEFQLHGGKAIVGALVQALTRISGVRLAEPGEFTRRAFLNGKVDLLEAEAIGDLVNAETEGQRRFALLNSQGAQSKLYEAWRKALLHARAMLEAELDFSDEGDVPGSVSDAVWKDLQRLVVEIDDHIAGFHRAEMIRDGFDVVILGAPNAGKSSLLNALAKRDVAIVSDEPGTTRDLVEVVLDLGGQKVRLTDTAGIREQAGRVEQMGIDRAVERARNADLVLLLGDGTAQAVEVGGEFGDAPVLRVRSKADLPEASGTFGASISVVSGEGIGELLSDLERRAAEAAAGAGDVLPSRLRHVELLSSARLHLSAALGVDACLDIKAEDLRLASEDLGRIAGKIGVEDVLDAIFSQFCIGK